MRKSNLKQKVQKILDSANVKINGNNPWDIQIHNENFYARILSGGSLALGESYMDGWWDCKKLDEFFYRVLKANLVEKVKGNKYLIPVIIKAMAINLQKKSRAFHIGKKHYDVGNTLYKYMLDKRLVYTCGYWESGAKNLDKAQEAKLDLVCRKIGLKPGMRVLDIGCGWGSFLKYAAEKYKIKGFGITVSKEQIKLGNKLCKGLDIKLKLQDYRNIKDNKGFDRIVSLGMFEHVGVKNYGEYLKVVHRNLKDDGLFLLHTIGSTKSRHTSEPWTLKYIFTNSMLPSAKQIAESSEDLFILEDWHNFGIDYYKTLMAWHDNFRKNWLKIKKSGKNYDERFYRMWSYYLLSSAGGFRARNFQLWQIVFSKKGTAKAYKSIR